MNTDSSEPAAHPSCGLLVALPVGALMLILTVCAAFTLTPTVARALTGSPSPTNQLLSWSVAEIAKPTYTPFPIPTSTPSPTYTPVRPTVTVEPASNVNFGEDLPSPTPDTQGYSEGKYIVVSISQQHLYAYDNGQLVISFIASTGIGNSTRIGNFKVLDKIPNAYGATWNIWMPNWLGIYWSGTLENGIHALPILPDGDRLWSGYLGSPISFGCVVLGVDDSLQLYNWADVGTPVQIQP